MPLLTNLFGTVERVAWGLGVERENLLPLGRALAELREPRPPRGLVEAWRSLPLARAALSMRPREMKRAPVQERVFRGDAIDLTALPVQLCWPGEAAPLITWPLVLTMPPAPCPRMKAISAFIACRCSGGTA